MTKLLAWDGDADDQALPAPTVFDPLSLGDPIGWALSTITVDTDGGTADPDTAYGADGPGMTTVSLTDGAGNAFDGDATNLFDTATGNRIFLYTEGDLIVGRVGTAGGVADAGGEVSFALAIDGSTMSLAQYRAILHPDNPTEHDEPVSLFGTDGLTPLVYLQVEIEDNDGDVDTALLPFDGGDGGVGAITFEDDGPHIISVTPQPTGPNLVVNGSFEDGHGLGSPDWDIYDSLPGWTKGDGTPFEIQTGGVGGLGAQDGNALVELDSDTEGNPDNQPPAGTVNPPSTNTTVQQTISTENGQTYELSFWYASRPDHEDSSGMKVFFGGVEVFDTDTDPLGAPDANGWYHITLEVTATGPSSVLAFQGTGAEDEFGALLDNVSLYATAGVLDDEGHLAPWHWHPGRPGR